jgi:hypothetical protein
VLSRGTLLVLRAQGRDAVPRQRTVQVRLEPVTGNDILFDLVNDPGERYDLRDDPTHEEIFAKASDCGIDHLKLEYRRYDGFGTIYGSLDAIDVLEGIRELDQEYA